MREQRVGVLRDLDRILQRAGEEAAGAFGHLGRGLIVIVLGDLGDGIDAAGDRRDGEGDEGAAEEEQRPVVHDIQRVGNNDEEGGRHRGEARGDDQRLLAGVNALFVEVAREKHGERVAAGEGNDRVDGALSGGLPDLLHDGTHERADKLNKAEVEHHDVGDTGQRNAQRDGNDKAAPEEGDHVVRHQRGGADAGDGHEADHKTEGLGDRKDEVKGRALISLGDDRRHRAEGDHCQRVIRDDRAAGRFDKVDDVLDDDDIFAVDLHVDEEHEDAEAGEDQKLGEGQSPAARLFCCLCHGGFPP